MNNRISVHLAEPQRLQTLGLYFYKSIANKYRYAKVEHYGSTEVAQIKIEAGAKEDAYLPQEPKIHGLQKMRKAGFAAYIVRQLRHISGQRSN